MVRLEGLLLGEAYVALSSQILHLYHNVNNFNQKMRTRYAIGKFKIITLTILDLLTQEIKHRLSECSIGQNKKK